MRLRKSILATSTAGIILATSALAFAQKSTPDAVTTGYAPVNGLKLYYEIHGTGEPLILLYGGVVGITMFGPNLAALSQKRKVIAVELQGHGHTADIDRPLSFEAMGDDIAALMRHLGIERADVMGYSLGGGVALQMAYDWSKEVAAIRAPTMIVFADADAVRPAHIMEFFSLLGGGQRDASLDGSGRPRNQLGILPGLMHYNMSSSPALATSVTPFLDAPMPGSK